MAVMDRAFAAPRKGAGRAGAWVSTAGPKASTSRFGAIGSRSAALGRFGGAPHLVGGRPAGDVAGLEPASAALVAAVQLGQGARLEQGDGAARRIGLGV